MKEKFLKVALQRHFFDNHKRVLVAVSGGFDSMNLISLLEKNQKDLGIHLGLAHIHYGQRPEADQEAAYLKSYAKERDLPFHLAYFKGVFTEKAGRDFRYRFFEDIMLDHHYSALVTAHHADDQAETVLMRLIRGSRLFHLSSIKERQPFADGELIRPLLSFSKSDLPDIFHFEDSSNTSSLYFRNRVRQNYIPQLKKENPNINQQLRDLSQQVSDAQSALSYFITAIDYKQLKVFKTYPQSVQNFFLEDYLSHFPDLQLTKAQFKQVLHLIKTKKNQIFPLKSGYTLLIDYETFSIEKIHPETDALENQLVLKSGSIAEFGGYLFAFNVKLEEADSFILLPSHQELTLRYRQTGDKILLKGHRKKISRLFIDEKLPLRRRNSAIIVQQDNQIMTIVGIAISDLSKSLKSDTIGVRLYIKKIKMEEVSC